jgi:hypothetical protein
VSRLENVFSWSVTRDKRLRACARQYWFQHYGSWNGWEDWAPQRTREAWVLKQLKGRHAWVGIRVHECVARSLEHLRRGQPVLSVEQVVAITLDRMRSDFANSRKRYYRDKPKAYVGLFEHEYGLTVPDAEWKRMADVARDCLRHFYASETFARLRTLTAADFIEIEEKTTQFPFEGTPVWVSLDCAVWDGERTVIYDWKTGDASREDHSMQLTCYALYGSRAWKVPPDRLRLVEYNLRDDRLREYETAPAQMEAVQGYMRGSIADMRALLSDPARNEPMPEDAFATTDDPATCRRCCFLKICPRGKEVLAGMRGDAAAPSGPGPEADDRS